MSRIESRQDLGNVQAHAEIGEEIDSRGVAGSLGRELTGAVAVPTIGFGGSPAYYGQILVIDDMLGAGRLRPPGRGGSESLRASSAASPYNGVMKARPTLHALGAAIGIFLALSISRSVIAQDHRGSDNLPLVVKTIPDQKLPLIVATDRAMIAVVGAVGVLQILIFLMQCYLLWETILSANLPKIVVRRIKIDAPNIDDRPVTRPFQAGDNLRTYVVILLI